MSAALQAAGLTLIRGDRCLFRDLGFTLDAGELLWIEGPNGSGKTSLLRAMAGLIELEDGSLTWNGADALRERQHFHGSLAWMAHKTGLKGDLTLLHNLRFEAGLRSTDWSRLQGVLERLNLTGLVALPLRSLSAGQQRRVTLARMLLADACLWLMDEPFTNLDAAGRDLVTEVVAEHLAGGGMAVVASHQPMQIETPVRRVLLQ